MVVLVSAVEKTRDFLGAVEAARGSAVVVLVSAVEKISVGESGRGCSLRAWSQCLAGSIALADADKKRHVQTNK